MINTGLATSAECRPLYMGLHSALVLKTLKVFL